MTSNNANETGEKMLNMRTDDWLEACKEIDALNAKLAASEARVKELESACRLALDALDNHYESSTHISAAVNAIQAALGGKEQS